MLGKIRSSCGVASSMWNTCWYLLSTSHIMNMYTAPEYRRQGIAFHTLDLLVTVKDAKEQGVLQIALETTDMGRPLYERYGFVKMEDEMELKE